MKRLALFLSLSAAAAGCSGGGGSGTDSPDKEIRVAPVAGPVSEAGSETSFTVVLNAEPGDDVVIALESSDDSEGLVSPSTITFTGDNWDAPQTVLVTGVDDAIADGNVSFEVTLTVTEGDSTYEDLVLDPVVVANLDDETAGIRVGPVAGVTSEFGDSVVIPVVLQSEPTADVVLTFASSEEEEATLDVTTLTFTPVNWNAPQNITASGVDDDVPDGMVSWSILFDAATSTDPAYSGYAIPALALANVDNDSPGIIVTPLTGSTREIDGTTSSLDVAVRLSTQPTAKVELDLTSSDTGEMDIEDPSDGVGTVTTRTILFSTTNWDIAQVTSLIGEDDTIADGDQPYELRIVIDQTNTLDAAYKALTPPKVNLVNLDDDSPGLTVSPLSGIADETGGYMSFTMVLETQPTATVTIPMSVSSPGEARLSETEYTFTTSSWDDPITIYVAGVEDGLADGNQPWFVQFGPAESTDPNYAGRKPANLLGHTLDDAPIKRVVIFDDGFGTEADDIVIARGWNADVVSLAADLELALADDPDLVIVESNSTALPLSTEQSLEAWVTSGGSLILSHWDLASSTTLTSALGVSVTPYSGHRFVFPDSIGIVDTFDVVEDFPFPLTGQDMVVDNGQELVTTGGELGARLDSLSGPGALALTNGGRVIVNGFAPDDMMGTDNDGDGIPDMRELYENEIALVLRGASPVTFAVNEPNGLQNNTSTFFTESSIEVAGVTSLPTAVTVSMHIAHGNSNDIEAFLVGPDGTRLELMTDVGGTANDGVGAGCKATDAKLTFNQASPAITAPTSGPIVGSFKPEGATGLTTSYAGKDPNGTWTLEVADDASADFGAIKCWSLTFTF